jgi:hypothetical protein
MVLKKFRQRLHLIVEQAHIDPAVFLASEYGPCFGLQLKGYAISFDLRPTEKSMEQFNYKVANLSPRTAMQLDVPNPAYSSTIKQSDMDQRLAVWENNLRLASAPYQNLSVSYNFRGSQDSHITSGSKEWAPGVESEFQGWLAKSVNPLIENISLSDPWSLPEIAPEFTAPDADSSFTRNEKVEIRESVKKFRARLISETVPTAEQLRKIDDKLNYLSQSLDKLNKFDFKSVVLTVLLGIATDLIVDPAKIFAIFKASVDIAHRLLG